MAALLDVEKVNSTLSHLTMLGCGLYTFAAVAPLGLRGSLEDDKNY